MENTMMTTLTAIEQEQFATILYTADDTIYHIIDKLQMDAETLLMAQPTLAFTANLLDRLYPTLDRIYPTLAQELLNDFIQARYEYFPDIDTTSAASKIQALKSLFEVSIKHGVAAKWASL